METEKQILTEADQELLKKAQAIETEMEEEYAKNGKSQKWYELKGRLQHLNDTEIFDRVNELAISQGFASLDSASYFAEHGEPVPAHRWLASLPDIISLSDETMDLMYLLEQEGKLQ